MYGNPLMTLRAHRGTARRPSTSSTSGCRIASVSFLQHPSSPRPLPPPMVWHCFCRSVYPEECGSIEISQPLHVSARVQVWRFSFSIQVLLVSPACAHAPSCPSKVHHGSAWLPPRREACGASGKWYSTLPEALKARASHAEVPWVFWLP